MAFLEDVGAAIKFLAGKFLNVVERSSWWKVIGIGILAFLVAGMFEIANFVGLVVLLVMGIKLFKPVSKPATV